MTPFYVYYQHHTAMAITRSMTTVQNNNSAASKKIIDEISALSPKGIAYILCEIGKMIREKKEKAAQENKKD
tara:strand:+ start:28905 stop:29120 length:216 start_codon:yes stop_codon:yes gene_type:complete